MRSPLETSTGRLKPREAVQRRYGLVMQLGRQVECGPRDQVLRRPEADYTRMLLDAVPGLEPARRPSDTERPLLLDASAIGKTYTSGAWPGRRRVVQAAVASVETDARRRVA